MTYLLEAAFIVGVLALAGLVVALVLELLSNASRPGDWRDDDPSHSAEASPFAPDADRHPTRHPEDRS